MKSNRNLVATKTKNLVLNSLKSNKDASRVMNNEGTPYLSKAKEVLLEIHSKI